MAVRHRVAVLIACKNGAETIADAVRSAVEQADVYVVSDGSSDATAQVAENAGATVLERERSGGKPDALRAGNLAFDLAGSYEYVAVLDDDTILEPGYLDKLTLKMDADEAIAAASGRIDSVWDHARRWNALIAMRAFMYWSYQTTIKRGQNALHVVNVICGANTAFRADVFKQLIDEDAPYAIDDMYWLAEIIRRKLGRVAFVHDARSWTIDPHRLGDWYRQTVRWSWGQFQSVRGHRLGVPIQRDPRKRHGWGFSWFDAAYLGLLIDWFSYALEPLAIVPLAWWLGRWFDPLWFLAFYLGTSVLWISIAAFALRKPRLLVLAPAILALDLLYRLTMLHAVIKTIRHPRIETCTWDSPERFQVEKRQSLPEGKCPVKALITGGAGFIGSHLAELLLRDGDEVFVLDDLSTGSTANVAHLEGNRRFHMVVDSVLQPAIVNELVNKADVVYHLAAAVGVKTIVEQPVRTLRVNLGGTETVLDACCRFDKPVLLASTSEVYGDHRSEHPLAETPGASTAPRPRSGGRTPTRRRWTSSSRSPTTRSSISTP